MQIHHHAVVPISSAPRQGAILRIPSFSLAYVWGGTSVLLRHALIGNSVPMSLVPFGQAPASDFVAAIRWAVSPYTYRYLLWDKDSGINFPVYNGEVIPADIAYLEIWGIDSSGVSVLASPIDVTTSLLPTRSVCQPCELTTSSGARSTDSNDMTPTLEEIPELPEDTYCNPLCAPLC